MNQPPKILILSSENSPYRPVINSSIGKNYKTSYINAIIEVPSKIESFAPDVFIHDWMSIDETQSRMFHLRHSQSTSTRDVSRIITTKKVTPNLLAFASDAFVDKTIDETATKLNLEGHIQSVLRNDGHREILKLVRAIKKNGKGYRQHEINNKIEETYHSYPNDSNIIIEMGNSSTKKTRI